MKSIIILLFLFVNVLVTSCTKNTPGCKGAALPQCVCFDLYSPVCGCDKKTYENECFAKCQGLTSWTSGKCP